MEEVREKIEKDLGTQLGERSGTEIGIERKLTVCTENNQPYDILLQESFAELAAAVKALGTENHRICIVTDSHVAPLYLQEVSALLKTVCRQLEVFEFPAGEESKTLDTVRGLYEKLILSGFDRKDFLVALGGGVTGDLTGYAAATYLRGIPFIQVPTTLLAQIDSSIGGKTGVDFEQYKNMVGAFHQPILVYMNLSVLKTLPEDQFASGMGELLKYGISLDRSFYDWVVLHEDEIKERYLPAMMAMVARCCRLKQMIVEKDPTEKGDRALLNYGHTIGHAIEKMKNFQLLHGECVALGNLAAAYISWKRGMICEEELCEIQARNKAFGLPVSFEGADPKEIVEATKHDKKMDAGQITFILLKEFGHAYIDKTVTDAELLEAVRFLYRW